VSVSVLNTDAGLSGKTLVNAEDTQTVTGAKTFDRDPSAPFAVTSGSAVVTNLDADKLDGQEGSYYLNVAANHVAAWTSYTPIWSATGSAPTLGNATLGGKYVQIGKLVTFRMSFTFGSTSAAGTGAFRFTLPVTAANSGGNGDVFVARILDTGTQQYNAFASLTSSTTLFVSYTGEVGSGVGAGAPITWATGDLIEVSGSYEAA
jgi:hypothetical protein